MAANSVRDALISGMTNSIGSLRLTPKCYKELSTAVAVAPATAARSVDDKQHIVAGTGTVDGISMSGDMDICFEFA